MNGRLGKVRDGLVVGPYGRNSGREPSSVDAVSTELDAVPRSRSSHAYVIESPFASDPEAVSVKGVSFGMVKPAAVVTVGTVFPVPAVVPHVAPPPLRNDVVSFRLSTWKKS